MCRLALHIYFIKCDNLSRFCFNHKEIKIMKSSTKILVASLLAVSLTSTLVACPSNKHEHKFEFDSFIWTKQSEGYRAVAHYVCAKDGESVDYVATVTLTDSIDPDCENAGSKIYTATYDGHTGTKVDTVDALGHSYVRTKLNDTDGFVFECSNCHEKYYEIVIGESIYFFQPNVTVMPTFKNEGKLVISYYGFYETQQKFVHLEGSEFPCDTEVTLPKFEDGSKWSADNATKEMTLSNVNLTKLLRAADSTHFQLADALKYAKVINADRALVLTPDNFDEMYPNMIMSLEIRAGENFTDGSMVTGPDTLLQTVTALRKDNFHLPSNTNGFAYKHQTKDLVGYSNNGNATTTNYALGGFISASANKVVYCVWSENHTFDDEHSEIITEATMESTGMARYYCQTAGHYDYEDRVIEKVKYTFVENIVVDDDFTTIETHIAQGTFRDGDEVAIQLKNKQIKNVTIFSVNKTVVTAGEKADISILRDELDSSEIQVGALITEPQKHILTTKVEVYGHVYTSEEGGRHMPFFNGYRPTFLINGAEIPGTITFDTDIFGDEGIAPGTDIDRSSCLSIEFASPVYLPYDSTIYAKESSKTTAAFTVDTRNELLATVSDNYTAAGTYNKTVYSDENKLPTQYDYVYSYRLRGFDERSAVSGLEDTQYAPGATLPTNTRKIQQLNAIWGSAILTGAVTSARVVESRGTYVTVIVKGKAAQINTNIMVKLADGSLKASVITGLLNSDGETVESVAVGQTAEILLRGIELNEISTSGVSFVWEKVS